MTMRVLGVVVVVFGFYLSWVGAPLMFEDLSGHELPAPRAESATSMTAWSGVAFLRLAGVAVLCLGAVMAASGSRRPYAVYAALAVSAAWAVVVVSIQQVAIWDGTGGVVFAALFAAIAIVNGATALAGRRSQATVAS